MKTQQLEKLKELVGDSATVFMDFYKKCQPCHGFPALDCYVNLLDIESILDENTNFAPIQMTVKMAILPS